MRLFARRNHDNVDRRQALEGIPVINPGVKLHNSVDGKTRVSLMLRRGVGIFEWMRPKESPRSYDLDEFGTFVINLVDGKRTVLDLINAFQERFRMSRRETEMSVVAFLKLLMQRHVLSITVEGSETGTFAPGRGKAVSIVIAGLMLFAFALQPGHADETPKSTYESISSLSASARAPGSPGNLALEKMVEGKFSKSGFEHGEIIFEAPILTPGNLRLDLGKAGSFQLEAMHPTLMRPGNFVENEFSTRLVYLGRGEPEDLIRAKGVDLKDAIAVMDYNCRDQWLDLFRFGVSGFVFVGEGDESHFQATSKVFHSEMSVPRFYIDGEQGQKLKNLCAGQRSLKAQASALPSRWKNGELRNLWVLIPGSDSEKAKDVVLMTAPMDANSVVPARSFGAQRAINMHLLLRLLEDFKVNPPKHSVMLVATNADTQLYAGDRMLAWHLLVDEGNVEVIRKLVANDRRLAKLYSSEYSKLKLEPVLEEDKADLYTMIDVLWKLDAMQKEGFEEEEGDLQALDLEAVTPEDVKKAIAAARVERKAEYEGFFNSGGMSKEELKKEKEVALGLFDEIEKKPYETFMDKAFRSLSPFEDEKRLESWRSQLDWSTGERVYIKSMLQDEFKSLKNRTAMKIMALSSSKTSYLSEEERAAQLKVLSEENKNYTQLLVLFNKMDLGIGRSRTFYRQIAINEAQRELLKSVATRFVEKYRRWEKMFERDLSRSGANDRIRTTLGSREVKLILSLELDGHGERIGFQSSTVQNSGGGLTELGEAGNEIALQLGGDGPSPWVDALSGAVSKSPAYFFGSRVRTLQHYHSASTSTPVLALCSAFVDRGQSFGPNDRAEKLDAEALHQQQNWVRKFLSTLCSHDTALSSASVLKKRGKSISWANNIRTYAIEQFTGKPIPTKEVGGTLVSVHRREWEKFEDHVIIDGEVINCYMGMSDDAGNLYIYGIPENRWMAPQAYKMDPDFQEVLYALDKGRVQTSKQIVSKVSRKSRTTLPMFEAREFVIKDRNDPTTLGSRPIKVEMYWPKDANAQADLVKVGFHGGATLTGAGTHRAVGPAGVYTYRKQKGLKEDRLMVITNDKRCVLGSTEENPRGEGFLSGNVFPDDFFFAASLDMARLNRYRNAEMKGVVNQMLGGLLEKGDQLNLEAKAKKSEGDHLGYLKTRAEALGAQVKAYQEISDMKADMLKAIVAYMALMIPFCFFLQKLLFNFTKMEKELAAFSILFFCMFVLFRNIHPAFKMAMSAEAIFIAFVLGAIGCFTTLVLHSRFSEEMNLLFRGVMGIGEKAATGTVGQTAMMIGVQNMRRRKVRTLLTTATIVLVVFTMLAFSSVSKTASPTLIAQSESPPYTGIFYHWPNGTPMDEASFRLVRDLYSQKARIQPRRTLSYIKKKHNDEEEPFRLERVGDAETFADIKVFSGLTPDDLVLRESMALVKGMTFSSSTAKEIILPASTADALGLGAGDVGQVKLKFLGHELLLKGLVDDQRYRLARDLNPALALVPMVSPPELGSDKSSLEMEVPDFDKVLMDMKGLALIPEGLAAEWGAEVGSVSVIFPDDIGGDVLAEEVKSLMTITDTRFFIGNRLPFKLNPEDKTEINPGVYYVGSGYKTSIGGLTKLIIPLLIAGFIVLNTMLGTVYERKSEIAIFNAIGLNPTHIFTFFLAEAFVYSLLGAVGGYLIGQLLAIGLQASGLVTGVNINFSSMMVVYAIAFTMALVMLSTVYPGMVATRVAVPSGKRKWSMPDHDSNTMDVVFPFIYRHQLAPGAMAYLAELFESFGDQSLGEVVADLEEVKQWEDESGKPVRSLLYDVALAPFDLGVTQKVTFVNYYDDHVRSFRMSMKVERVSGQETDWANTNKPFMERMRKHLIRWRNIDPTRQNYYVERSENLFSKEAHVVHG